jgi:cell division protein FtsL
MYTYAKARYTARERHGGAEPLSRALRMAVVGFSLVGVFIFISNLTVITSQAKEIYKTMAHVSDLETEFRNLQIEYSTRQDLEWIQRQAIERLGMMRPNDAQIRVVSIPDINAAGETSQSAATGNIELVGEGAGT